MRKIMAVGALILTSFLPNNRAAYADSCDGGLVDLFGGAAIGTSATALVAGESALIIVGTSGVAVLTAPAVAVGATVTAVAGSIVYAGHETWCWMTDWLATKHFLNEDTEAISEDWKPTGKILKAGTPIFLAGYHMWDEDIDHGSYDPKKISYASVVEESNGDSYYIPSNSLNALYAE